MRTFADAMHQQHFLILALLLAVGCSKNSTAGSGAGLGAPVPVQIAEVARRDMPIELRAIGNVESIATVGVKAQVGGELIQVHFTEGQEVKKGDVIFSIQPKLYSVQLAGAEANLARDRAIAENARHALDRGVDLQKKGVTSPEQMDQWRYQTESAAATVKADEALVEIARVRLGYASIKAPLDGVTGGLTVHAGTLIKDNADDPMVVVNQLAPIYATFAVPESQLADIRAGQAKAALPVAAYDPKDGALLAEGSLAVIANTVDMTTGTIQLKAVFQNDDRALWPGAFVDLIVRLGTESGVAVIPASAITNGQKGQQVYVVKADGTAELRIVSVSRMIGQEAIVKDGVAPGERVVTVGQLRLVPGARVEVKTEPRGVVSA